MTALPSPAALLRGPVMNWSCFPVESRLIRAPHLMPHFGGWSRRIRIAPPCKLASRHIIADPRCALGHPATAVGPALRPPWRNHLRPWRLLFAADRSSDGFCVNSALASVRRWDGGVLPSKKIAAFSAPARRHSHRDFLVHPPPQLQSRSCAARGRRAQPPSSRRWGGGVTLVALENGVTIVSLPNPAAIAPRAGRRAQRSRNVLLECPLFVAGLSNEKFDPSCGPTYRRHVRYGHERRESHATTAGSKRARRAWRFYLADPRQQHIAPAKPARRL